MFRVLLQEVTGFSLSQSNQFQPAQERSSEFSFCKNSSMGDEVQCKTSKSWKDKVERRKEGVVSLG